MKQENVRQEKIFEGFIPPASNYFRMPNEWINICAEIKSLAELKVVQYVLRHTWGFREYDGRPKPITIDEFMHGRMSKGKRMDKGTGLSKQSVIDGVKNAIKHGYLICEIDDSDKARIEKSYALNMITAEPDVKNLDTENGCQESRQQRSRKSTANVKNLDSKGKEFRQRSKKGTGERHFGKERGKDSAAPASEQEPPTQSQPEPSSPSLSKKLIEDWFTHFDQLYQKKSGIANYRYSRRDTKIKDAIVKLIDTGATFEQVEFVFNDIWDDKDAFWQEHKGKVWVVESQFATRVAKINAPAQKRRTASGFASYTEDKSIGLPAEAIGLSVQTTQPAASVSEQPTPDQEQPKQPAKPKYGPKQDEAPTYSRLKLDKPAQPRTAWGRRLQQEAAR